MNITTITIHFESMYTIYDTILRHPYEVMGDTGFLVWFAIGAVAVGVAAIAVIKIASRIASIKAKQLARPAAEE